jgi:ElaB/YqjD/DUF883 family membrane-anchored ribosome-binding protein
LEPDPRAARFIVQSRQREETSWSRHRRKPPISTARSATAEAVTDAAQDVYGQARESAANVVDTASAAAQNTAGSFERALRNMIEQQPYTAVAIALGLGWLFGRMHRPL